MTTTHVHPTPTPPPPPAPPAPPRRRKSRAVPATVGAVLASFGAVLALAGAGTLAVVGDDGTVGSGNGAMSTSTSALVSETADVTNTADVASVLGHPKIRVQTKSAAGHPDVFVGVGPKDAVDRYLAGTSIETVTDVNIDPLEVNGDKRAGIATPAAPASQSFWVASDSGRSADVNWKVRDGDYRVVVMNADGSTGVSTDGHVEVGAQYLSTIALSAMLAGFAALALGIALIVPSLTGPARYPAAA
jgi:hypothetical protein